jgi:Carboxypeptidase regulatory-like domain
LRRTRIVLALIVALCRCVVAQVSQVDGRIDGIISGPSGSPVANASVSATNTDTGFERSAQSNERGEYEVPLLPLGTYRMTVHAPGFATYEQTGIKVRLDAASQVNVALQIGSTGQTVNVTADASILNTQTR